MGVGTAFRYGMGMVDIFPGGGGQFVIASYTKLVWRRPRACYAALLQPTCMSSGVAKHWASIEDESKPLSRSMEKFQGLSHSIFPLAHELHVVSKAARISVSFNKTLRPANILDV